MARYGGWRPCGGSEAGMWRCRAVRPRRRGGHASQTKHLGAARDRARGRSRAGLSVVGAMECGRGQAGRGGFSAMGRRGLAGREGGQLWHKLAGPHERRQRARRSGGAAVAGEGGAASRGPARRGFRILPAMLGGSVGAAVASPRDRWPTACVARDGHRMGAQRAGGARPASGVGGRARRGGSRRRRRPAWRRGARRREAPLRHRRREGLQDHRTDALSGGVGEPPRGGCGCCGVAARTWRPGPPDSSAGDSRGARGICGALRRSAVCGTGVGDGVRCGGCVVWWSTRGRWIGAVGGGGTRAAGLARECVRPRLSVVGVRGRGTRPIRPARRVVAGDAAARLGQEAGRAHSTDACGYLLDVSADHGHVRDAVARVTGGEPCGWPAHVGGAGSGACGPWSGRCAATSRFLASAPRWGHRGRCGIACRVDGLLAESGYRSGGGTVGGGGDVCGGGGAALGRVASPDSAKRTAGRSRRRSGNLIPGDRPLRTWRSFD